MKYMNISDIGWAQGVGMIGVQVCTGKYRYVSDIGWSKGIRMAKVIKLFSCSTQLSMKFKMLINIEMAKIHGIFRFNSLKPAIFPANKS